jgi:hypothetical protein
VVALIAADARFEPASTVRDLNRLPRLVQAERKSP